MPRYEYRCRECGDAFELSRPMSESSAPATCPSGHTDTVKLLSTVAVTGMGSGGRSSRAMEPMAGAGGACAPAGGGGGCCGGGACGA